jgi:hypothetical protein
MKKSTLIIIVVLVCLCLCLDAQDTISRGKPINIPFAKYGISLGNSPEFNGIRLNLADENVKRINGLNVTCWYKKSPEDRGVNHKGQIDLIIGLSGSPNKSAVINGLTVGVVPVAGTMQQVNFGLLGLFAHKSLNGISVGGLYSFSDYINGICVSGLGTGGIKRINGIAAGGIAVYSSEINGISLSPIYAGADSKIRGITIAGLWAGGLESKELKINGISIAGLCVKSEVLKGIAIAGVVTTNETHGLSVGIVNKTNELHGLQLGLINHAGNNRKPFKVLPVVNIHLGRKITQL